MEALCTWGFLAGVVPSVPRYLGSHLHAYLGTLVDRGQGTWVLSFAALFLGPVPRPADVGPLAALGLAVLYMHHFSVATYKQPAGRWPISSYTSLENNRACPCKKSVAGRFVCSCSRMASLALTTSREDATPMCHIIGRVGNVHVV